MLRILLLGLTLLTLNAVESVPPPTRPVDTDVPASKLELEVQALVKKFAAKPPPPGGIVCIGSSTFKHWWYLSRDLAPLPAINCGFGGSRVEDAIAAIPRLVLPFAPKVIAYYCGDNNMGSTSSDPKVPVQGFKDFVAAVRKDLPGVRIVYLSIKPSPHRWAVWPKVQQANAAVKTYCAADPGLTFLDIATPLLGADGKPRSELYDPDQLHLNKDGYALLVQLMKPVLEAAMAGEAAPAAKATP